MSEDLEATRSVGRSWARADDTYFYSRLDGDGRRILQPSLRPFLGEPEFGCPCFGFAYLCRQCSCRPHISARTRQSPALDRRAASGGWRGSDGHLS